MSLPDPAGLSWITVKTARRQTLLKLVTDLGRGEREALALALDTPGSLVLLDDAMARRHARLLGLAVTGTLGVLIKAKRSGHLDAVTPVIARLEALRFRLDPETRASVLKLAGEAP